MCQCVCVCARRSRASRRVGVRASGASSSGGGFSSRATLKRIGRVCQSAVPPLRSARSRKIVVRCLVLKGVLVERFNGEQLHRCGTCVCQLTCIRWITETSERECVCFFLADEI